MEHILDNAQPDELVLTTMMADIKKNRADEKKDKQNNSEAFNLRY